MNLPAGLGRSPPPDNAPDQEKRRYNRLVTDELTRRDRLVDGKLTGDVADEIEVTSQGDSAEIRIANPFPYVPNRFEASAKGNYHVGKSKATLADQDFIYLTSTADVGEKFTVRFWRR